MLKTVLNRFRRHREAVVIVIPAAVRQPLSSRERLDIRDWLNSEMTQKVLGLLEARHPGTLTGRVSKVARSEWDQMAAVNLLHRIAGWESYRNSLITLAEVPVLSVADIEEQYPST